MTAHDDELLVALRRSAHGLVRCDINDIDNAMDQLVAAAARAVPGADAAGLSRTDPVSGHMGHATDDAARELERWQDELHQGPGIPAAAPPTHGVVVAHDLAGRGDHERWPAFAPIAVERGYRSILSAQLSRNETARHGSLNVYSHEPHAFDDQAAVMAGLFAAQASLTLYGAERAVQLERALATRDVIGQAKGILMERFAIDDDEAFDMLVTSSQTTNIKLVDVARWLTSETTPEREGHARSGERSGWVAPR